MPPNEEPYIIVTRTVTERLHNPKYPQRALCECGDPYYRHFDTYDNMAPVGCKYCQCGTFTYAEGQDDAT